MIVASFLTWSTVEHTLHMPCRYWYACASMHCVTNAQGIVNPRNTETRLTLCIHRCLGVVNRHGHNTNTKCWILSTCRVYLAKRSTHKVVFKVFAQFEAIYIALTNGQDLENWEFLCRQTDRADHLTPWLCMQGNK